MFVSDRYNILTFQKLLGGCKDLSLKIINEKQQLELEDRKQEVIEQDFYNWLNYDLPTRSFLGGLLKEYHSLTGHEQVEYLVDNIENKTYNHILIMDYFRYYNDHKDELGLNGYYERITNMNTLFQKKWWKTTEKNNQLWKKIHKAIRLTLEIKVFKCPFRYFHGYHDIYQAYLEQPGLFREPTLKEKYLVYEDYYLELWGFSILFIDSNLEMLL
jgi:hypothetical protein